MQTLFVVTAIALCFVAVVVDARWDWNGQNITRAALRHDPKDPTKLHHYTLPDRNMQPDSVNEHDDLHNLTYNSYTGNQQPTDAVDSQDYGPLVAFGTFKRYSLKKGWDWVELTAANETLSPDPSLAYYGVGYLEGYYTWDSISDSWFNWGVPLRDSFVNTSSEQWTKDWINKHIAYLQNKSMFDPSDKSGTKPFATQVGKLMRWLDGLVEGYTVAVKDHRAAGVAEAIQAANLTYFDLFVMNFQDEVGDVQQAQPGTKMNPNACPPKTTTAAPSPAPTTAAPTTSTTTTAAPTTTSIATTTTSAAAATTTTGTTAEPATTLDQQQQQEQRLRAASELSEVNSHYSTMHARWNEHCSSLLKLTSDDLVFTHTTWSHFRTMGSRQYKTYHFEHSLVLSGYPTNIASSDDWVITSNGLIVSETTNNQFSNELSNKYVLPNSVSEFLRVVAANLLSTELEQWTNFYINGDGTSWEGTNSGTYCNQILAVNMAKVTADDIKQQKLKAGTFMILEQLPGPYSAKKDMSAHVTSTSFWPSFNRNYFQSTAEASCVSYYAATYGPLWGYKGYCRDMLFDKLHGSVTDVESMKTVIRYNDYKKDAASKVPWIDKNVQGPSLSIAARYDLIPVEVGYGNGSSAIVNYLKHALDGAIDAKIASWKSMMQWSGVAADAGALNMTASGADYGNNNLFNASRPFLAQSYIVNGPSQGTDGGLPVFQWSTAVGAGSHRGMPDTFNHTWVTSVDSLTPPLPPKRGIPKAKPSWTVVIVSACIVGTIVIFVVVWKAFIAEEPESVQELLNESRAAESGRRYDAPEQVHSPVERVESPTQPLIK